MKKILFLLALLLLPLGAAEAQKIALVDMEYILKKDPSYAVMNRQIEDLSKKWQAEVAGYEKKAEQAYQSYQSEAALLSAQQKKQREESIVALEKQAYELKRKYFGPEGELFKKRVADEAHSGSRMGRYEGARSSRWPPAHHRPLLN